ncbi:MAG: N-6 DNA methylase [Elusimicrobia bacterium]|nr:N-6 DNA methylase [Elusimicrobiota bacterium]
MEKEQAKKKIKELVDKYEAEKAADKIKRYTEAETKTGFIEPLFQALGWDTQSRDEVGLENQISAGRVDYSFKFGSIVKFYVEAKALRIDLDKPDYTEQALYYAWHKGVVWTILTDFEAVKVYNAEWKTKSLQDALLFEIKHSEYINKFEQLWLLSKESIEQGLIDKEAEKWGKKIKKQPVSKQILDDLLKSREKLTKDIQEHPRLNEITTEELDESIQRILDRLIFIRTCEDRNLEQPNGLMSLIRASKNSLWEELKNTFRKYDDSYNSKLFEPHLCEKLVIDDKMLEDVIETLYHSTDNSIHYNFADINADVLGSIYEQYLGHILKKSQHTAKLKETHQHRKEQGIYYTPQYIVDYIVKNTVGEVLKETKAKDLSKLKILDPACGSGSFLIRAFDEIVDYCAKQPQREFGHVYKTEILKNNIYGVDLDRQAVEITQMNLLLKTLYQKQKLPALKNIRCGNSLIDDKAIAGEKAFKWEDEFKEVMSSGGFDVIIGNPPYGYREIPSAEAKEYYSNTYETSEGNFDMYRFFIERSINLLKEKGILGIIIPNTFLSAKSYQKLRSFMLNKCKLINIYDLGMNVFEGVTLESIILILQKNHKNRSENEIRISFNHSRKDSSLTPEVEYCVSQNNFDKSKENTFNINISPSVEKIISKIENGSILLENIAIVTVGINTGYIKDILVSKSKIDDRYHKMISGRDISRYSLSWAGKWIVYDKKLVESHGDRGRTLPDEKIFLSDKILVQRTRRGMKRKLICAFDNEQYYNLNRLSNIVMKDNAFQLKYCLGILNSFLMDFYFQKKFNEYEVKPAHLRQIPIKQIPVKEQQIVINLASKMLALNDALDKLGEKITDERKRIESEIEKTDQKIDELVYNLYGLTKEEIRIIEKESIGKT